MRVLVLVCWFAVFGTPVSLPQTSAEVWREAVQSRVTREEVHHEESHEVTDGATTVPCHHEAEVLELFNELTIEWNVTNHAGELCLVDEERIHELLGLDNQPAIVTSNLSSLNVTGERSDFCERLYLLTRELLLHLNYTAESCLLNGTLGDGDSGQTDSPSRLDYATAYGVGFAAILVISLASLLGVCLVPLMGKRFMRYLSSFLVALGVAALVCDAVLHLIPHSFLSSAEQSHDHSNASSSEEERLVLWKGSVLLAALLLFYIFEFFMKYWQDRAKRNLQKKKEAGKDSDQCGESAVELQDRITDDDTSIRPCNVEGCRKSQEAEESAHEAKGGKKDGSESEAASVKVCKHQAMLQEEEDRPHYNPHQGFCHGIVPVAWIIIIGDAMHNFADGLAIGVAFSASLSGGLSTSIAVLFHELPHELGDYAILLSTGMKWHTAAFYNFVSALTAFIGMFIGVAVGNASLVALDWILVAVAGIFLYVALVDMLPGLYQTRYKGMSRWFHLALQLLAFLLAYGALLTLAYYEHDLESIIHTA